MTKVLKTLKIVFTNILFIFLFAFVSLFSVDKQNIIKRNVEESKVQLFQVCIPPPKGSISGVATGLFPTLHKDLLDKYGSENAMLVNSYLVYNDIRFNAIVVENSTFYFEGEVYEKPNEGELYITRTLYNNFNLDDSITKMTIKDDGFRKNEKEFNIGKIIEIKNPIDPVDIKDKYAKYMNECYAFINESDLDILCGTKYYEYKANLVTRKVVENENNIDFWSWQYRPSDIRNVSDPFNNGLYKVEKINRLALDVHNYGLIPSVLLWLFINIAYYSMLFLNRQYVLSKKEKAISFSTYAVSGLILGGLISWLIAFSQLSHYYSSFTGVFTYVPYLVVSLTIGLFIGTYYLLEFIAKKYRESKNLDKPKEIKEE